MIWAFALLIMVAATGVVFGWQEVVWDLRRVGRRRWLDRHGSVCASHICGYLFDGAPLPDLGRECNHEALLELLHSVCTLTSGYDTRRVALLARHTGLCDYLLHRTFGRLTCTRAVYALTALQAGVDIDLRVPPSGRDLASQTLFALAATRTADPDAMIRHLTRHTLSEIVVAAALEMHHRRHHTTDYRHALDSANPAVLRVGLAAVRRFRPEDTATEVGQLVDTCDHELVEEALYTLATLQLPVARRSVARALSHLGRVGRKRFYRYLITEGYSSASLEMLCLAEPSTDLCDYTTSLGESYKYPLDKPQPIPVV